MQKTLFFNEFTFEINHRSRFFIKLAFLVGAILLCGTLDAPAQVKRTVKRNKTKTVAKNIVPKESDKTDAVGTVNLPVSVVNSAEADFLSGEASVTVNPKQPTIIRLGLSQNAVSIIEFPASDGIYYIHEGNPKLVSVFGSPTRESDRSITIYPGEAFVSGSANSSATITLQMRSGLILILEFVPVSEVRRNAHRCVINYDRETVISARRAAGLAFNLGETEVTPQKRKNTRAVSKLISPDEEKVSEKNEDEPDVNLVNSASLEITKGKSSRTRAENRKSKQKPKTENELWQFVNKRLADALKNPVKTIGNWSKSANGLSLAVSEVQEIDETQRLIIIAVRNESAANLRLVPGSPELQILTVDEKGNPLNTERLERKYIETTSLEGLIQPGAVAFYAIVYDAPVMGASQRLSVQVSHREAADSPVTALLLTADATKE